MAYQKETWELFPHYGASGEIFTDFRALAEHVVEQWGEIFGGELIGQVLANMPRKAKLAIPEAGGNVVVVYHPAKPSITEEEFQDEFIQLKEWVSGWIRHCAKITCIEYRLEATALLENRIHKFHRIPSRVTKSKI